MRSYRTKSGVPSALPNLILLLMRWRTFFFLLNLYKVFDILQTIWIAFFRRSVMIFLQIVQLHCLIEYSAYTKHSRCTCTYYEQLDSSESIQINFNVLDCFSGSVGKWVITNVFANTQLGSPQFIFTYAGPRNCPYLFQWIEKAHTLFLMFQKFGILTRLPVRPNRIHGYLVNKLSFD